MDRLLYTPAEAAARLSVSENWVKRRATSLAIPHTRVGRYVRFTAEQLEQIAQAGAHDPARPRPLRRKSA